MIIIISILTYGFFGGITFTFSKWMFNNNYIGDEDIWPIIAVIFWPIMLPLNLGIVLSKKMITYSERMKEKRRKKNAKIN